jgi:probable phosphoglycerate mutase
MSRCTWVYVIRHGQSTFNAEGRFQGCCDEPVLTPAGIATATAAAAYLQDAGLGVIFTSPLRRASQTAVRIHGRLRRRVTEGPSFRIDARLREIDLPLWEGRPLAAVREEFGVQYRDWKEQPHLFCLPGQPPAVPALIERTKEFWDTLIDRFAGTNVLLVTHGGTGRALISTALGITAERFHLMQQSNGGISILEFTKGHSFPGCLHAVNAIDYLGQKPPKLKETKTGLRMLILPTGSAGESQRQTAAQILRSMRLNAAFADSGDNASLASMLLGGAEVEVCQSLPERQVSPNTLDTILWLVDEGALRERLLNMLGLPPGEKSRLRVVPFAFTVLHFPGPGQTPILQAMNLHDTGRLRRSEAGDAARVRETFMWRAPQMRKE